jgi:cobalt-zinc-cadmium efflux system outer membrane protein
MAFVILSCCLVLPFRIQAELQQTLTLDNAIERTLAQNPQLHQFTLVRQGILAQRETSELSPGFTLGLDVENAAGSGSMKGTNAAEVTLSLSSVIEMGDKLMSRISVVDANLDVFELNREAQTLDVLGQLTSAFIRSLTTQEQLNLAAEALKLSEDLHKKVSQRAQRGAASDAEVMRARAMVTQSGILRSKLLKKLERQKIALSRYWGETQPVFSSLQGDLFAFGQEKSYQALYEKVKQSPAIDVFASKQRLKDAELRLVKTQNSADLSWQFGVRRFEESDDTALTLGVSIPLFSQSRNTGEVKRVLAERNAVAYKRTDALLNLHEQLYTAYSLRQQNIATYEQLTTHVIPDLKKALSLTQLAYDRGRLKYQDWIAAQQELLSAKQQMIESASNALLNQAIIEQLTAEPLTN